MDSIFQGGFTIFDDRQQQHKTNSLNNITNKHVSHVVAPPKKRMLKRRKALRKVSYNNDENMPMKVEKRKKSIDYGACLGGDEDSMETDCGVSGDTGGTNHLIDIPTTRSSMRFESSDSDQAVVLRRENKNLRGEIDRLRNELRNAEQKMQKDSSASAALVTRDDHTHLEACLFSVGNSNRVRRVKLGRHASIDTRKILDKVAQEEKKKQDDQDARQAAVRLSSFVENSSKTRQALLNEDQRKYGQAYFRSVEFAKDIMHLCVSASKHFKSEKRLLELSSPMYVFGDLHGNLDDLHFFAEKLWTFGMGLTAGTFLCLGDYVDRGPYGIEVVAYLMAQKVLHPHKIHMLRGNHETRAVNGMMDHYKEGSFLWQCLNRFGEKMGQAIWENVNKVFDRMPLAAVVDGDVFCVHGGIPRPLDTNPILWLNDINTLPPVMGITPAFSHETGANRQVAMDLIWADPASSSMETTGALDRTGFGHSPRGSGVSCYGTRAVEKFLQANGLSYIIRAHEPTKDGIHVSKGAKVFTVFSTSKNHGCGDDANSGCILIDSGKISMIQHTH
eukprot:g4538.t1